METLDTILRGRLAVIQTRNGYRFSLDAVLLADFAGRKRIGRVMDLGTGNGVMALILATLRSKTRVTGLEVQEAMVARARKSVALNSLEGRVEIAQGDVRFIEKWFAPESFDLVVCNPPYRAARSGRVNPDPEKRIARHEVEGRLIDFLKAGAYVLRRKGLMALVYPATRAIDLLAAMRETGLEPKRLRWVHAFRRSPASLVLVEGSKDGRSELSILPPLIVYRRAKEYTLELRAILAGRSAAAEDVGSKGFDRSSD
jgi:tRNA1Val (adenine37-N6)-methyltransferase